MSDAIPIAEFQVKARPWPRVVTLAVVLVAAAGIGWALAQSPQPLGVRRLPDGSVLTVEAVTRGPRHRLIFGNNLQRVGRLLFPRAHAGALVAAQLTETTDPQELVCWVRRSAGGSRFRPKEITVTDADGCELRWRNRESAWQYPFAGGNGFSPFKLGTYPRREPRFDVSLYQIGPEEGGTPLARFTVRNPAVGSFAAWRPEPLPITRHAGDLTVKLVSWRSEVAPPRFSGYHPEPAARFRLERDAKVSPAWEWVPFRIECSDSTGNVARSSDGDIEMVGSGPRACEYRIHGKLCPREPAWKLRVEFSRNWTIGVGDPHPERFPRENLWRIRDLPVPPRGGTLSSVARTVRQGIPVEVSSVSWDRDGLLDVVIGNHAREKGCHLTTSLAKVAGSRGEKALASAWSGDDSTEAYSLTVPERCRALNLTLVLQRSRWVEFVAHPSTGP